jgi:cobalt-zinc-cadmium efflux system protein
MGAGHGHDHGHGHGDDRGHDHDHGHGNPDVQGRLRIVLYLSIAYMFAEAVGGWLTNSLALLADAGHMLSDVAALGLSLFAGWISRRPTTPRHTFGYYRAEILAALVNGAALAAISALIVIEAVGRLSHPQAVRGPFLLGIASGGLVVNLIGLRLLHAGRHHSMNLRGAWLHVGSDALGSFGAMVAGFLAWRFGWDIADPVASIVIALLVVYSSWSLLRQAADVLMEGTPRGIDADEVRCALLSVQGVRAVHDLHIWTITSGMHALSAHVAVPQDEARSGLLVDLRAVLGRQFGIDHVTIQVEEDGSGDPEHCARAIGHP